MAAPPGRDGSDLESEKCDEINVFSERFDPLRALYDTNVGLPCPDAEPFEGIDKFQDNINRLVDRGVISKLNVDRTSTPSPIATAEEKKDDSVSTAGPSSSQEEKEKAVPRREKTVFNLMDEAEGPLALLKWCRDNKRKARVCTRTFKGLRSICIGYVVAFDKFLNLALADVNEVYRKPPLGKTILHQEILTFTKILQHFNLSLEPSTNPKKGKKTRNRKDRKMRLERRLRAEGVFIENYHPPPMITGPPSTRGTCGPGNQAVTLGGGSNEEVRGRVTEGETQPSGMVIGPHGDQSTIKAGLEEREKPGGRMRGDRVSRDRTEQGRDGRDYGGQRREVREPQPPSLDRQRGKDLLGREDFHQRYVRQLFIKGDSVVLISVKKRGQLRLDNRDKKFKT